MKNVTITVEDATLEWVRIEAAKRNTSVSRLVGEMLTDKMQFDDAYARAQRDCLGIAGGRVGGEADAHVIVHGARVMADQHIIHRVAQAKTGQDQR